MTRAGYICQHPSNCPASPGVIIQASLARGHDPPMEFKITFNWKSGASVEIASLEDVKQDIKGFANLIENLEVGETYTVERVA